MSDTESKEVSTDEPAASTAQGVQNDTSSDFLTESEKVVLQDWLVYVTGLFAAVGVALGLNANIQDQWSHNLVSASGQASGIGSVSDMNAGLIVLIMPLSIIALTLLGYAFARNIDNENQTAFKVAAAVSLVAVPVVSVVTGVLVLVPIDALDLEFVNVIVSGLGAGIAAAVGSAIVVWLTENQAPESLN